MPILYTLSVSRSERFRLMQEMQDVVLLGVDVGLWVSWK